jgi:hypothetical protein
MPSTAEHPRDPGLALERTTLSWQRMATGFATLAALIIGAAAHRGEAWMALPAPVLLLMAVAVWRHARRRAVGGGPDRRALAALAAGVVAAALVAALLTLARSL